MSVKFDSVTVRNLFGSFDAEQDSVDKFKEYFVTNNFYEIFSANFPLRIAVGNKGSGKSAMLRALKIDNSARPDCISVSLSVSDLVGRAESLPKDRLRAINHWKSVFATEAAAQLLTSALPESVSSEMARSISSLPRFISCITRFLSKKTGGASDVLVKAGLDLSSIKSIVFYLDDLDRCWDGGDSGLHIANTIIDACFDISKESENIMFRIAVRWDLWDAISRKNSDIDKIRQNVVFLRWTIPEIYVVTANRVAKYFGFDFPYQNYLGVEGAQEEVARVFDPILEDRFFGCGKWDNTPMRRVLLSMIRSRPRDLIILLTLAAEEAYRLKSSKITSTHLQNIFPRYSEDRLSDLIVEFGTRLSGLEQLLYSFKPSKATTKASDNFQFSNDKITKHLKGAISVNSKLRFANERSVPDFRRILDFLYRIDFLQAWYRQSGGEIERVSFQDRQLTVIDSADFGYSWEVLPAYRWGIQPTKIEDVIASLS